MTKTIEEAAKRFAEMKTTKQAGSSVERDRKALLMTQFFQYALEELPLASRLTAEEKESVRKMYKELSECIENRTADIEYLKGKRCQLVIIFGADFFKEEE